MTSYSQIPIKFCAIIAQIGNGSHADPVVSPILPG